VGKLLGNLADLAKSITPSNRHPTSYIQQVNDSTLFLAPTTESEICSIIKNFKLASPGHDDIHAKIVKKTSSPILKLLSYLINASLSQGVFPDELKIAKVIPLYKANDPTHVNNYRPVSVLPVFSKLFERIVYLRLLKFVNTSNLFYQYQFGFRENHSTLLALTVLLDKISDSFNNSEIIVGIFLDFKKAFDTIDHNILLQKLSKYGIRGVSLSLISSYLSNRKQYVQFHDSNSKYLPITCGVPQGSILGPILFLLYVNDLPNVSSATIPILFADDTNLFFKGKSFTDIYELINSELSKIYEWILCNKLSLNIAKTNFMIFKPRNKRINVDNNLVINGQAISLVDTVKFLGVHLDSSISWHNHLSYIKTKISKGLGIINKTKRLFNQKTLITLYYSFIYPYLTYCIEIWGSAANTHLFPLLKLQKKFVRIATNSNYLAHTENLFSQLSILPLAKLYVYNVLVFMYKIDHRLLPSIFTDMFTYNTEIHRYNTRSQNQFHIPLMRLTVGQNTLKYKGPKIWNNFIVIFENTSFIYSFKTNIKKYLNRNCLPNDI